MNGADLFGELKPGDVGPFTQGEKIACLERELGFRRRLYPSWVEKQKMKPEEAAREVALMQAILEDVACRPWPDLMAFLDEWRPKAARITFKGVPIVKMHRDELLAVIAYARAALEADASNDRGAA